MDLLLDVHVPRRAWTGSPEIERPTHDQRPRLSSHIGGIMSRIAWGLATVAGYMLVTGTALAQAFFSNAVVNTCTTLNCATPTQGEARIWSVNEFYGAVLGNVDVLQRPFTMVVNTGFDEECIRIDVLSQTTDLSASLTSQDGTRVWRSADRSSTDRRPLIIARVATGLYELQINQARPPYKNAYFKLFEARYNVGNNPNCRLADITTPIDLRSIH